LIAASLSVLVAMMPFRYVERWFATGLVTGDIFWPRWRQLGIARWDPTYRLGLGIKMDAAAADTEDRQRMAGSSTRRP
jgi:hypothetical protein